jgi:predicted outer membrane lipoprotein
MYNCLALEHAETSHVSPSSPLSIAVTLCRIFLSPVRVALFRSPLSHFTVLFSHVLFSQNSSERFLLLQRLADNIGIESLLQQGEERERNGGPIDLGLLSGSWFGLFNTIWIEHMLWRETRRANVERMLRTLNLCMRGMDAGRCEQGVLQAMSHGVASGALYTAGQHERAQVAADTFLQAATELWRVGDRTLAPMYLLPALDCCIYVHLRLGCQTMVEHDLFLMRLYGERLGMAHALAEHYAAQVHARPLGIVTSGWSPLLERVTYTPTSGSASPSLDSPSYTFLPLPVPAPRPTLNAAPEVAAPQPPRHPSVARLEKPPVSPTDAELEHTLPALFGAGYAEGLLFASSPTT